MHPWQTKEFNGAWYSSLFIHYYPTWWDAKQVADDIMFRIPPSWSDKVKPRIDDVDAVIVRGTSFREPECEHDWCALKGAKKWKGPVEEGKILSGSGEIMDLNLDRVPVQGPVPKGEDEL